MNTKEKEIFIGEIQQHISPKAGASKRHNFKRTKFLGKVSPGGIALLISAMVGMAVLGGYFYSTMNVEMAGEVDVTGRTLTSVFSFDDIPIEGGVLNLPLDLTAITSGDVKQYEHNITNEDMGDWMITIGCSLDDIVDPMDPYYGIWFDCSPNNFVMSPTETVNITFWFNCSHEYMDPLLYGGDGTLIVNVTVLIESVSPPVAGDDGPYGYHNANVDYIDLYDLFDNDMDYTGEGLEIVSCEWVGTGDGMVLHINGVFPDQFISVSNLVGGAHSFTYTIEDGNGLQDTATVEIYDY